MYKTLHYLFDPLCGWCYGAAPAVAQLLEAPGISVKLWPTGLFSGAGARPMDDDFAAYAWSNDQRIQTMTGQSFSQQYRQRVLSDRQQHFDSGPATLALTAAALSQPSQEVQVLKAIQHARYVEGHDVTSLATLSALLAALGLQDAADRVVQPDAELLAATHTRTLQAQALMREFGAQGVPTFIAESGKRRWLLDSRAAYAHPDALARQLQAP